MIQWNAKDRDLFGRSTVNDKDIPLPTWIAYVKDKFDLPALATLSPEEECPLSCPSCHRPQQYSNRLDTLYWSHLVILTNIPTPKGEWLLKGYDLFFNGLGSGERIHLPSETRASLEKARFSVQKTRFSKLRQDWFDGYLEGYFIDFCDTPFRYSLEELLA